MSVTALSDADEVARGLFALTNPEATVKSRIRTAARLLGWSISRVHEAWYRRATIKPNELNTIRTCIAKKQGGQEGISHGINERVLDRLAIIEEQNNALLALLAGGRALPDRARAYAGDRRASGSRPNDRCHVRSDRREDAA